MYIEKLGKNNRQIDSKLLHFAADYYGFDYIKLRMTTKPANKLGGYRSYAINCNNLNGEKINTLLWFADFEFGSLLDEVVNNDDYVDFMASNMEIISRELSDLYLKDQYEFVNNNPEDNLSADGMDTNN